jgi:hypothetical protein
VAKRSFRPGSRGENVRNGKSLVKRKPNIKYRGKFASNNLESNNTVVSFSRLFEVKFAALFDELGSRYLRYSAKTRPLLWRLVEHFQWITRPESESISLKRLQSEMNGVQVSITIPRPSLPQMFRTEEPDQSLRWRRLSSPRRAFGQ